MATLYLQNSDYIVKIIGYDGSSITGMEVAEASAPNTWYTFGSVALESPNPSYDGAYIGTHDHKFVGFGANEAAWAGNNFIIFTPTGLEAGQSFTADALLLSNDWGSLYHQTGLIATDVYSELGYGLAHNYILDSDATDPAGGEDGTSTSVTHVSAEGRQYASFDGSSSFIEATDLSALAGAQWSISMWLKTDSTSGRQDFFSQWYNSITGNYPSIALGLDGGILKGYYRGDNKGSIGTMVGSNLANGEWRHVTYVKDASHLRLFVDGSQVAAVAFTGVIDSNAPVVFGAWDGQILGYAKDHYFNGSLDNIMIYSRGLSAAEVSLLHTATTVAAPPTVSLDQDPSGVGIGDVMTATVDLQGGTLGYFAFEYYNADNSSWTSVGGSTNAQYDLTVTENLSEKTMQVAMEVDGQWYFSSQWTMPEISSLVGHWSFDNGDATADVGSDATATGASFVTDAGRTAASFDGDDQISIPHGADNAFGTGDFTVSMWINPDYVNYGGVNQGTLWSKGYENLEIYIYDNKIRAYLGGAGNGAFHNADLLAGSWQHIVLTRVDNSVKFYINGVESTTIGGSPGTANLSAGSNDVLLGVRAGNGSSYYQGKLDDVRHYSTGFDASEVDALYNSTTVSPPATPIQKNGYYPLYLTESDANGHAGGNGTSHSHEFGGVTYYMPNGLTMNVDQFHGTYGLESLWSFDSDASDSISGFDGTVTAGSFESAAGRDFISFERESTGIVSLPDSLDSRVYGDYTMSAWVKLDTIQDTDFGYFGVMTINGVGLSVTLGYPSITSNGGDTTHHFPGVGLMSVDTWYHLVLVQEGSDKKLYLDGVLLGTNPTQPSAAWGIGTDNNIAKGYSPFDGKIDDLRLYSRAMDAEEVAYWYAETTVVDPGPTTDLTISMADSYGDGWNGNTLTISDENGNVVFTSTGPANNVQETVTLTVYDGQTYIWACGGGIWPSEISFTFTDANGVELVNIPNLEASSGTGTFVVNVLAAPATIEAAVDSFASDEMVVSVVLNTVAQSSAAAWAWSLSDDFVVGAPSTGTVVALGQTATISVTPGTVTVYVAAIDGSGNCIATADVTQDTVLVSLEISKSDTYGDGWNNAVFTMTDSNGVVVVNEGLASGGKDSPVVVNVQLAAGTYDYQLTAGSYPGEISMSVTNLSSSEVLVSVPVGGAPASGQVVVAPPAPSVSVNTLSGYQAIYFFAYPNQLALDAGADKWAVSAAPFGDVGTTIGSGHVLMDLNAAGFVYSATEDTLVGYAAVVNSSTGEILAKTQGSGAAMQNQLPVGQEMVFMAVLSPSFIDEQNTISSVMPSSLRGGDDIDDYSAGPFYMGDLEISSFGTIGTDFDQSYSGGGLLMPTNFHDGMGGTMSAAGIGRMVKDMIRKLDMHQLSGADAAYGQLFQSVLDGSDLDACKVVDWVDSSIMLKLENGGYSESTRYKLGPATGGSGTWNSDMVALTIPAELLIVDGRVGGYFGDEVDPGAIQGLLAPAEMVISGQASVASGEVTMTVEVGENAVDQGAVSWVYALDQTVGDLGQVAVGTSVTIGSSAVFTPAPAPYTAYVAAVDANGIVLATDSFVFDATPVRLVKWSWYTTDWSGLNNGRMTLTDSLGNETISPVVSYDTNGAWHSSDVFELREDVYSWAVNEHSIRASDQGHLKLIEVDAQGTEIREIIYVWALQTRMHKDGTSWPNQEFSGQFALPEDTVDPIIALVGDASMTVFSGNQFEDPGYTVSDDIDPSPNVSVSGHESLNISEEWVPSTPQDGAPVISGELLTFDNPNWYDHTVHKATKIPASAESWAVVVEFDNYAAYGNHSYHFLDLRLYGTSNIGYLSIRMTNAGGNGFNAYYKDGDNNRDQETALTGIVPSGAMKITREGDNFKFYYSLDKSSFELVQTIPTSTADVLGNVFGTADLQISLRATDAAVDVTKFTRTDIPYGAQEGDYTITYSAEDFSGNTHSVQRTVSVVPETYQWHHNNKLSDVVQYLFGTDLSGERSHMYLTNKNGYTKLYITKDLETWSAFSAYDHNDSSIEGAPVNAAYGPDGKVLLATSTGCLYLIELDGDSAPISYTKVHDNGGTSINRVHYAQTPNSWVIEYGETIYTMPVEGGTLLSRMSIPSGAKVTDISAGEGSYAFVVRKSDYSFTTYVVLPNWASIHNEEQMRAVFTAIGGTNIDYYYNLDKWIMADDEENVIMTDDIATWLLP